MADDFLLKLTLTFIIGAGWVTLATVAAERLGSKVGGYIGGLPSTVVVGIFFIGWTQGPERAAVAAGVLPLAFAANAFLILAYVLAVRRGITTGIGSGLLLWLLAESLVVLLHIDDLRIVVVLWLIIIAGSVYALEVRIKPGSRPSAAVHYTARQLIGRALLGGSMIAFAVLISRLGGPLLGGVFSAFPGVTLSTLYITARSLGRDFSRAISTPLLVSSVLNGGVFGLAMHLFLAQTGLVEATLLAYLVSMAGSYGTYLFIQKRLA